VAALRVVVRYDEAPTAEWVLERPDHWIGVDLNR
jgi:hypothetical protein